jgi:hypothetical protein
MTMHARLETPFEHLRWTAQDITDAVPLRLHQLDLFDAASQGDANASNGPRQRLRIAHGYRGDPAPVAPFRIR